MSNQGASDSSKNQPAANPKPPTSPNKNKSGQGNGVLVFFVIITFILVTGGIGAGYYFWQEIQKDLQTAKTERSAIEGSIESIGQNPQIKKLASGFDKKVAAAKHDIVDLNEQLDALTAEQERMGEVVTANSDIVNRSQIGWMLYEVQHVLRMAQHRLLLDRDLKGALTGLSAADTRLGDINDVRLIPIRQSIANQIKTLKQYDNPDYVGLQLKLDNAIASLRDGLVTTPTAGKETPAAEAPVENEDETTAQATGKVALDYVKGTFEKARSALNKTVKVTHGEQQLSLYIEEQEKKRAYEFLRQKLLGAKYAVSTRDNNSFHKQLGAALAWLESNETTFTNKTTLVSDITAINKNDLLPELPDISEPSALMEVYIANHKEAQ